MKRALPGMTVARLFEGVGIALESVRANKIRAALTILGVAIGVMVVIAMASMITGINRSVEQELSSLGPKTFMVMRFFRGGLNISDGSDETSPWRKNPKLTTTEVERLGKLPAVDEIGYREETGGPVSFEGREIKGCAVVGLTPNWIKVAGGTLIGGRSFTQVEFSAGDNVAIINDVLADDLFPGREAVGKHIKIFGAHFTVLGVYMEAARLFGAGKTPVVIMPHTTFAKTADYEKGWLTAIVRPTDSATVAEAQDQVITALRIQRGLKPTQENNFSVVTQDKMMDTFNSVTSGFFVVMLALSSVGLMVGGIGVIAIMMISVTERTREIGVRKALGATRREILFQFLVEAATLTLLGGVVGMILGGLIAWAVRSFTPVPAAVPLWSVVVALIASTVTGVFFGLYPAGKASRLDPVEALRFE